VFLYLSGTHSVGRNYFSFANGKLNALDRDYPPPRPASVPWFKHVNERSAREAEIKKAAAAARKAAKAATKAATPGRTQVLQQRHVLEETTDEYLCRISRGSFHPTRWSTDDPPPIGVGDLALVPGTAYGLWLYGWPAVMLFV